MDQALEIFARRFRFRDRFLRPGAPPGQSVTPAVLGGSHVTPEDGVTTPHRQAGLYIFGPFVLDPRARTLLRDGARVVLTARLFETLLHLVKHPDRVIDREELEQAVWPGRGVQKGNLQKAVSSLRKALEDGGPARTYIITMPGRGFQFSVPVAFRPFGVTGPTRPARAPTRRLSRAGVAIVVAALVTGSAAIAWFGPHKAGHGAPFMPPQHSIAILPFANMSGEPGQDYFSDGLADDLINSLGRVAGLRVAARASAFSFKGTNATIKDIGRRLNVAAILQGSVRREGQMVHVTVKLIDTRTEVPIWSHSYDQDRLLADMFVIQTGIADAVTASFDIARLPGDAGEDRGGTTHNPEAFDAYLRGVAYNQAFDGGSAQQAIVNFDEAIALDPNFAEALAGRALAHSFIAGADAGQDKTQSLAAEADAERATKLAPMLAEAHRARALVMFSALDFAGAAFEIGRACALAPDNALAQATRGSIEARLGHNDIAMHAARMAIALDPLNPSAFRRLGQALYWTRHFDEALAAFRHAGAVDNHPSRIALSLSASTYLAKHDPAAAARICADGKAWTDHVCLAMAYHDMGRRDEAAVQFETLHRAFGDRAAFVYAEIYTQWGQPDAALNWLQVAWRLKDNGLGDLKVSPFLDPIRGTATFKEIESRLNFPT